MTPPPLDRLPESLLFAPGDAGDELSSLLELGIVVAHRIDYGEAHLVEKGPAYAEPMAMTNRAPHDAPEHVLTPGAVRKDALRDQEGGRSRVIRDDAHRDVVFVLRAAVRFAADFGSLRDERAEQVGLVVARHPLDDARDPLETCARVDARFGQRSERGGARWVDGPVELHEDQIPDLHPAKAARRRLLAEGRVRHSPGRVTVVPVNLGARTARARVSHLPKVVAGGARNPENSIVRKPGDLAP